MNKNKIAGNNDRSPEKTSLAGKLYRVLLSILKWIASGSKKEPICRS
jgi:hypothetical protein